MVPQVLVVESYADLRAGIVSALQRYSFACDAVATPGAAVLKLREHDYAYVVVDVDSPESTEELISSFAPDAHVILISEEDPRDERTNTFAMLRKPFSRDELMARVRSLTAA
jgi:DNA-binding response OmpR family regulator